MAVHVKPNVIPLWSPATPGIGDPNQPERESVLPPNDMKVVRNIVWPTLTVYLPEPAVATGTGVVVCPGGAFQFLAIEHEGNDVARWLVERGVAAFVLRYRVAETAVDDAEFWANHQAWRADRSRNRDLMREPRKLAVADGQQAVKVVRERASEWGLAADRVGIVGFSAGGYAALGTGLSYDATNRPSFIAPIYPAPWDDLVVRDDAPPIFLCLASDDDMAVRSSLPIYSAWRSAGRSAELHVFARGGHGFGMRKQGLASDRWIDLFGEWLRGQGLLERSQR